MLHVLEERAQERGMEQILNRSPLRTSYKDALSEILHLQLRKKPRELEGKVGLFLNALLTYSYFSFFF